MRDNPGGLLSSAVAVADQFLRQGVIVSTRGRGGQLMREQRASAIGTWPDWPMVVLINGYTRERGGDRRRRAARSEARDHVGTRSFGKGSVQNVIELPDQSAMKLTTALYYTPNGHSIQAEGIEPDVAVEQLDPETLQKARLARTEVSEAALAQHIAAQDLAPPRRCHRSHERARPRARRRHRRERSICRRLSGAHGPPSADRADRSGACRASLVATPAAHGPSKKMQQEDGKTGRPKLNLFFLSSRLPVDFSVCACGSWLLACGCDPQADRVAKAAALAAPHLPAFAQFDRWARRAGVSEAVMQNRAALGEAMFAPIRGASDVAAAWVQIEREHGFVLSLPGRCAAATERELGFAARSSAWRAAHCASAAL